MRSHALIFAAAFAALPVAGSLRAEEASTCLATLPSGVALGKPFPASESWYGSESLAVILPSGGIWTGMGAEHRYRDKLFWWSHGYRPGSESNMVVRGRRLDRDAPPADISRTTNAHSPSLGGWTMLVAVEFPSPGCWEITGEYLGQKLSFVVSVPSST
jgi:hypothetical protein